MQTGFYRIGQVSKLFGLTLKTLRHYEKLGLFIPEYTAPDTNYRYYSGRQFERLRLIIFLKGLGLSLNEIRRQLDSMRAEEYIDTLRKQLKLLVDKNSDLKDDSKFIKAGYHATIYYSRLTDDSVPIWSALMEEITRASYRIRGDAVRVPILEKGIGVAGDDYLACIRVPVELTENQSQGRIPCMTFF